MCREGISGGRHSLRHPQEPRQARHQHDCERSSCFGGGGVHEQSGQGRAHLRHPAELGGRYCAAGRLQQRQREHLQRRRRRSGVADVRTGGQGGGHRPAPRHCRVYGRDRAAAVHRTNRPAHGSAVRRREGQRQSGSGGGHHDDGHAAEGSCGVFRGGRQGLPPRRHREGFRHDSPESGDDARFPHLRRGDFPRDASQGAVGQREGHVQHGQRRWRHIHQRHGVHHGERLGGQCAD